MSIAAAKLVTDRQKSSLTLEGTRGQLDGAAEEVVKHFPRGTRGTAKAAIVLFFGLLLDWLARATAAMVEADKANAAENADDAALRTERDEATRAVQLDLMDLRAVVSTTYGEEFLKPFGIQGDTPSDPMVLHRAGEAALQELRTFTPPPARRKGLKFDQGEWVTSLEASVGRLGAALKALAVDARENQQTLSDKNRAIQAYDFAFRASANMLEGLFVAAGRIDLAEKVRPSPRRPGQTNMEAPSPSSPAPTPAAGEQVA